MAEALALDGQARLVTGEPKAAVAAIHEAIAAASSAGDQALQAELTVALVDVANREARFADAETLAGARVCLIFPLKSQPKPTGAAGTKEAKASRSRTVPAAE